jgi:hypothetical protein
MRCFRGVINRWCKSRTVLFGFVVTLLGALQTYLPNIQEYIAPKTYGLLTAAIGITVIVLRFLTTVPLKQKQ